MENNALPQLKPAFKTEWFPVLLVVLSIIMGAYLQVSLPERVPVHWNISGQADGWSGPVFAAWLVPGIMVFMYLLFLVLPYFDPKKEQYSSFATAYYGIRNLLLGFFLVVYALIGAVGLGYRIPIERALPVLIGGLFAGLGYYLGSVKQNWFMGMRNPWTLESAVVWDKTHYLAARVFAAAGLLIALIAVVPWPGAKIGLFAVAILAIVLIPNIYSYRLYKKEKR